MFLLDDILTAPLKGVLWIFKEIVRAAEEEQAAEADRIKDRLRELYMQLETGQLSEAEFDEEERQLLDRLDELERNATGADEGGDQGDDEGGGDEAGDVDDQYDDEDDDETEEDTDAPSQSDEIDESDDGSGT